MQHMRIHSLILTMLLTFPAVMWAEDGVTDKEILFGQTAALTGTTANLGLGMQNGIMAAFHSANAQGGVTGKQLTLVTFDDQYEPTSAIANTKRLLEENKVFALIGSVGTPIANALLPLVNMQHILFLGPYSGADFLRTPGMNHIINIRASYNQEAESCVAYMVQALQKKRIAVLYQDDTFGRSGLKGVEDALAKRKMQYVGTASYPRNTTAVKTAALKLQATNPDAIIIIGVAQPAAEFIKVAKTLQLNCSFAALSTVGMDLVNDLGADGEGVIISQVMPSPFNNTIPIIAEYQTALKAYNSSLEYDYISLEGYIVAKLNIMVLKNILGEISRDNYIRTMMEMKDFDLRGIKLHFDANSNQGMSNVFLTMINKKGGLDSI